MKLRESLDYKPVELGFGTSGLRGLISEMTDLECFINIAGFLRFLEENNALKKGENIYIAGDLRDSTSRIMQVTNFACEKFGLAVINCGLIPTPALAHYAINKQASCIMVTGSHIPANRNGIKFYKREGEVLKHDESAIKTAVADVRAALYEDNISVSDFTENGSLKVVNPLPAVQPEAGRVYVDRFINFFPSDIFRGKKVIVYQQSAVGRDLLVTILSKLGAEAIPVGRSETFIPIDTENVTEDNKSLFRKYADGYPDAFAIVSTDGDSDRPFVIDEKGEFHRGDVLGCVVANYLGARFAATPISSNDGVDIFSAEKDIQMIHTKIGSPYVIVAMEEASRDVGSIVSWEVNGGFLTGSEVKKDGKTLSPLPTRDAILPILCALGAAIEKNQKISDLFKVLPKRFTGGGLIDDVSPAKIQTFREVCMDQQRADKLMESIFESSSLGKVKNVNLVDGLRLIFESNEVIHLRPSGNAPQFRVYTNADSQEKADELANHSVTSGGYIELLLEGLN